MFTRCPNCSATFRITEAVLEVAEGDVQCGSCSTVFNAARALCDESGVAIPPPATGTVDALEFDAPEQDWQRFFIEPDDVTPAADERVEPGLGADFAEPPQETGEAEVVEDEPSPVIVAVETGNAETVSLDAETADTETWAGFLHEGSPGETDSPLFVVDADEAQPVEATEPASVADAGALPPPATTEAPSPEAMETILDWNPAPAFPARPPQAQRHTIAWLLASLAATVALGLQAVHHFRDDLAADPALGATVRTIYGRLGQPLYPSWPLDAYEVRGTKAIRENTTPDALDIIAEIAVMGRRPVGLPMVRVVLRDRWANALASGVFDAAIYLDEAPAPSRVYAAGTLIPVVISVADPGDTAQGYEVDVCLPDRHFGLQCKDARDPFRR
jgi:predicted Zn finger-like uncharacterized protein